jgi:hypothetical protein
MQLYSWKTYDFCSGAYVSRQYGHSIELDRRRRRGPCESRIITPGSHISSLSPSLCHLSGDLLNRISLFAFLSFAMVRFLLLFPVFIAFFECISSFPLLRGPGPVITEGDCTCSCSRTYSSLFVRFVSSGSKMP